MNPHLEHGLLSPSRKRRFACSVYEAVLLFGLLFISDYLFDTLTQSHSGLTLRTERQIWLLFVLGLYFVWFWVHGGQTLAMKTWHIKLVNRQGNRVSYGRAIARYLLSWFITPFGLGFVYSFFDKNGLFPQDRLLGTRLVCSQANERGAEAALRVNN